MQKGPLLFSRLTEDDGERGTVLLRENNGCFAAKTQTFSSVLARLFAGLPSPCIVREDHWNH